FCSPASARSSLALAASSLRRASPAAASAARALRAAVSARARARSARGIAPARPHSSARTTAAQAPARGPVRPPPRPPPARAPPPLRRAPRPRRVRRVLADPPQVLGHLRGGLVAVPGLLGHRLQDDGLQVARHLRLDAPRGRRLLLSDPLDQPRLRRVVE